jgi:hypothetical protein
MVEVKASKMQAELNLLLDPEVEAIYSSETSADFYGTTCVTTNKIQFFIVTAVKTGSPIY